ncbi:hypothetical protein ACFLS8_05415 [Chloroflexota bacterium]
MSSVVCANSVVDEIARQVPGVVPSWQPRCPGRRRPRPFWRWCH